jgi:hypothetical protein
MRVRLKGINFTTKRLADGRRVTYWFAWRNGPRLRGEPGTPEFIASYNETVARKITPPAGVLLSVLQGYQASEDFCGLAERTREDYAAQIKLIESAFGDFPLSALADRRTRGVFLAWRDQLAKAISCDCRSPGMTVHTSVCVSPRRAFVSSSQLGHLSRQPSMRLQEPSRAHSS